MTLTQSKPVGTVTLEDLIDLRINKLQTSPLVLGATITYKYDQENPGGQTIAKQRTTEWTLSASAKSSLADLVPEVIAEIEADLAAEAPEPE